MSRQPRAAAAGRAGVLGLALLLLTRAVVAQTPSVNTIGMQMVPIEPGTFRMGSNAGDRDERPVHTVSISYPFAIGAHEVTNAQYEQFDPAHRALRGKLGMATDDDEAVVFVSWHDAVAFTEWLSEREGVTYRLPTEAEWEYAARAGTTTAYTTGESLPAGYLANPRESWFPDAERSRPEDVVSLRVGHTPPNAWGLYDVHGNVEEWTLDWYGPYEEGGQVDPVGRAGGDFKVTRGGSHSTLPYYVRSANRMGTLPDDAHWLIGFRVVRAPLPATAPLPEPAPTARHQRDVSQERRAGAHPVDPRTPVFAEPKPYVVLTPTDDGPFFYHNHQPAITETPNGDLLAIWYTTKSEAGRYLAQAASRLRHGAAVWEPASIFWDVPDRNDHGNALWWDGEETLYHVSGLAAAATWGNLAMVQRTSTDNGATWSRATVIHSEHGLRNQVIASMGRTGSGALFVTADAVTGGNGGSVLHVSDDGGRTWRDPGGTIAGIHASAVAIPGGRMLAYGRGDAIDGRMPKSVSSDEGATWVYEASPFDPLSSTQRLVLIRLQEGPLFLASFADNAPFTDSEGRTYRGTGLFGAVSYADGATWPVRKLITDSAPPRWMLTARSRPFVMSPYTAEPRGYMAVTQAKDGTIHLISSIYHYAFNQAWVEAPAHVPARPALPQKAVLSDVARADDAGNVPGYRYLGVAADAAEAARRNGDALSVEVPAGGQSWWRRAVDGGVGHGVTAEIRARVPRTELPTRGLELTLYLGGAEQRTFHLAIAADGLYSDDSFALEPLATGLDNHSAMHTYRVAVAPDGLVYVFRDGESVGRFSLSPFDDGALPAQPVLTWGARGGVDAEVAYVAYDATGAYAPSP